MALSQNEIARLTRVIALNGQLEIPQSVLTNIGYTAEKLSKGLMLADQWDAAREERDVQNDLRFTLARKKEILQKEADLHIASLRDNIDELIPDGTNKDNLLDRAVIFTDGAQRASNKEADLMSDGKILIRRVKRLPQEQQDLLAEYGWGQSRLDETWDMISAFEDAEREHTDAKGDKESKSRLCAKAFVEMQKWFRRAVRLIHRELTIRDPKNILRIVQRLELPISHPSRRGGPRPVEQPEQNQESEETKPEEEPEETTPEEGSEGTSPEEGSEEPTSEGESEDESKEEPKKSLDLNEAGVDDIDDDFEVIIEEEEDQGGEPLDNGRG